MMSQKNAFALASIDSIGICDSLQTIELRKGNLFKNENETKHEK